MKSWFSKFIMLAIISTLLVPQNLVAAGPEDEDSDDDLMTAFSALGQSMGSSQQPVVNQKVDQALAEAFDPLPAAIKYSDIPLDDPRGESPEMLKKAINILANTDTEVPVVRPSVKSGKNTGTTGASNNQKPINVENVKTTILRPKPIETEYRQMGLGLSLTLWSGGQNTMKAVLTNIIKQIYSDKDVTSFRFIVNSSPIPDIKYEPIDLNEELREKLKAEEQAKVEKAEKALIKYTYTPKEINIPVHSGAKITISAGMFATVKTVDELAGQIAKKLATSDYLVYGLKEDIRFTRNQEYVELINQIIQQSKSDDNKKSLAALRDGVLAELSAMDRLAAGGFNPWALQRYERRELSWMADVFLKSGNHSLARTLFDLGQYHFDDASRSMRILLQTTYMKFLQNQERGRGMATMETEFSPTMKWIRLRMKLFTEPFFLGLPYQLTPIVLAGGLTVAGIFNGDISHWALMAYHQTGGHLADLWHGTAGHVGSLVHRVTMAEQEKIVDSGYFGARSQVKASATDLTAIFYQHYRMVLVAGASVIAAGAMRFFRENIANAIEQASRVMRLRDNERKMNSPVPEVQIKTDGDVDKIYERDLQRLAQDKRDGEILPEAQRLEKPPQKARVGTGADQSWLEQLLQIKEGLFSFFASFGNVFKEKRGQIYVRAGDNQEDGFSVAVATENRPAKAKTYYGVLPQVVMPDHGDPEQAASEEGPGTTWTDRFDEWLTGMHENIKGTGKTAVRLAVKVGGHGYDHIQKGVDMFADGAQVVFIDLPVGVYKMSLQQIAYGMAYIDLQKEDYRVWKSQAPERERVRQEKRQKEEDLNKEKADKKRLEDERKAEEKRLLNIQKEKDKKDKAASAALQKIIDQKAKEEKKKQAAIKKIADAKMAKIALEIKREKDKKLAEVKKQMAVESAAKLKEKKAADKVKAAQAKIQKEKERIEAGIKEKALNERLKVAQANRKKLLTDSSIKPTEIYSALAALLKLVTAPSNTSETITKRSEMAENLGIDTRTKNWDKQTTPLALAFFSEWLTQAQKFDVTEQEVKETITLADIWNTRLLKNQQKNFLDVGLALYEILLKKLSPEENQQLKNKSFSGWSNNHMAYLEDLEVEKQSRIAQATKSSANAATTILNASDRTVADKVRKFYIGNEVAIVKWAVAPETRPADTRKLFQRVGKYLEGKHLITKLGQRNGFADAVSQLTTIEKAKLQILTINLLTTPYMKEYGSHIGRKGDIKDLASSIEQLAKEWVSKSKNIRELVALVESDCSKYQISPDEFKNALRDQVVSNPKLFADKSDVTLYAEKEYFWPTSSSTEEATILEKPLVELLAEKRKQFGESPAWKYDPIWSEKMHKILRDRLIALGQFPKDFDELQATWKLWTSRGVSTITDEILSKLLKNATSSQIDHLEDYAVKEGRVFDQGLRDEFAIRKILRSPEYAALMKPRVVEQGGGTHTLPALSTLPGSDRMAAIHNLVRVAQESMQDLGMRYGRFLEDLSNEIQSTHEEAKFIHEAKAKRIIGMTNTAVDAYSDSRVKMLKDILPEIKKWKPENQYKFLLYLRGSIESKDFKFIEKQFPAFGPERIRKIYQGLPIEAAMMVTHLYLQETILARDEVDQGYGKKLIKYLVSSATDSDTRDKSAELLDALLYGVEKSGSKEFQMSVLSALIAMKSDQKASIGETIKLILEQFPGVGPKIGQFMVATRLLSDDINEVLEGTQDRTLPPKRIDMYGDLIDIAGEGRDMGIQLVELLGSGSLKYSVKARELKTLKELVLQVFRQDVQNNSDLQISILNYAIDRLVEKDKRNAFLRVIVDGAMSAVAREKEFNKEAEKTKYAKDHLYAHFSDEEFTVAVPVQALLNKRLLQARYAKGGSFNKLSDEDKVKVGLKLLEMESKIMFSNNTDKDGLIWYDTDRHAGNYLIDVITENGKKKYKISPIDFGQLTSIKPQQREKVSEMFAYASMLERFGANDWLGKEVAKLFNITGVDYDEFYENLKSFFSGGEDGAKGSTVKSYFSLIAAVNEAIRTNDLKVAKGKLKVESLPVRGGEIKEGRLDLTYTDFVRGVVQLNQYEEAINTILKDSGGVPEKAVSPRKLLESKTKDILAEKLPILASNLSRKQELYIKYLDTKGSIAAKLSGQKYEPINIKKTRAELDQYSVFGKPKTAAPPVAQGTVRKGPLERGKAICGDLVKMVTGNFSRVRQ